MKDEDENNTNVDPRAKFVGTWSCKETCNLDNTSSTFTITISENANNSSEILISNFSQLSPSVEARAIVSGSSLSFPQQQVSSFEIVSGNGTFDSKGTTINLNYFLNDGGQTDGYSAVCTK